MRDLLEAGVVQWVEATRCDKNGVSMRRADRPRAASSSVTAMVDGGRRGKPHDAAVALRSAVADVEAELMALAPPRYIRALD
jgi:hypothetical protein